MSAASTASKSACCFMTYVEVVENFRNLERCKPEDVEVVLLQTVNVCNHRHSCLAPIAQEIQQLLEFKVSCVSVHHLGAAKRPNPLSKAKAKMKERL